ncbi:MAG: cache domain-containing protein [Planctomycetota bacterium]
MSHRLSIRLLAPLLLMLPVLIVSAVILSVTAVSVDRAAERDAFEELTQIRSAATERVDDLLQTPIRVVGLNRDLLDIGKLDAQQPSKWREPLLAQSGAFPSLSSIAWGNPDGAATWIARYGTDGKRYYALREAGEGRPMREFPISAEDGVSGEASSTFEYDPRGRPWYRSAVEAGKNTWSEPYAWAGDESGVSTTLGLSHSAPYTTDDGQLVGVISADLNLNDISGFLAGLRIGETGLCYIVDGQGRLIACSTTVDLTDEDNTLLKAVDSDDPMVASVATYWAQPGPRSRTSWRSAGTPPPRRRSRWRRPRGSRGRAGRRP